MPNPTPPSLPSANDAVGDYRVDLTRLLYMLYMDSEQQLARCDMKANLILTANSILLAVAASIAVNYLKNAPQTEMLVYAAGMLIPLLLLCGFAIQAALSVAYPRLQPVRPDESNPATANLFYSGYIATQTPEAYLSRFLNTSLDEVKRQAILGAHAKASILARKYQMVRRGIRATFAAFGFWVAFIVLTAL